MIVRDDLPPTPDWLPTPCAHGRGELRARADCPAHEAMPLQFEGDDG